MAMLLKLFRYCSIVSRYVENMQNNGCFTLSALLCFLQVTIMEDTFGEGLFCAISTPAQYFFFSEHF